MRSLQTLYPKMLHLTCLAHGLHRIAEYIRLEFPEVNRLISNTKAVFIKVTIGKTYCQYFFKIQFLLQAPCRRQIFKNKYPNLPLPPSPCITRWGTWLEAAGYYCDHFEEVKSVLDKLHDEDSDAIRAAKVCFTSQKIKIDLAYIKANFKCISVGITKLQFKGLSLNESIDIMESVRSNLDSLPNKKYLNKMSSVIARNPGYNSILGIRSILFNNCEYADEYIEAVQPEELSFFKWCPTTSCDVERSFSVYNSFLTVTRRKFTFENIKYHLIIQCNHSN